MKGGDQSLQPGYCLPCMVIAYKYLKLYQHEKRLLRSGTAPIIGGDSEINKGDIRVKD